MQYDIQKTESVTVFSPAIERLDGSTGPELECELTRLYAEGAANIELDISKVTFIDSKGLAAIISAFEQISVAGQMTICGAHGLVARIIRMTKVDHYIQVKNAA